jgi:type IV secretory pathway VirB9-like protein
MRNMKFIVNVVLAVSSIAALAQESARTVQYHSQDIVAIRAKVKYTTLIELPTTEKIMEAATGDKDFWIVDVVGNFCFVHPAKQGIASNLNLITDKGNIYSFTLQDISGSPGEPDLKVIVEPADRSAIVAASGPAQFVPAAQLEQSKQQVAALQSHVEQAVDEYKSGYPTQLKFDYVYKANQAPFDIQSIYHDDKFTYIKTNAPEKFSVYEMKDGKPNLVTYDLREGTYIIPKIMDDGYVELGKEADELCAERITRHDREQPYFSHRRAGRDARRTASRANTARPFRAAQGRLAEEPQDVRLLGAALLVIVAALFSSTGKKTPAQQAAAKGQPPQPTLQDNTDNNVQDMKNQVQAERQKEQQAAMAAAAGQDPALASATPAQQAAAAAFGPSGEAPTSCGPGRPCGQAQQGTMPPQLTPEQQQAQLIAAKERERADNSRFASNLVYSRLAEQRNSSRNSKARRCPSSMTIPSGRQRRVSLTHEPEKEQEETPGGYKRPLEANIDSAVGQPYLVYEGSVLDTVL